ncbi:MAG: DNA polymerase IV [Candidatus Levybacteria bacterium]|nr:DNA polymerase IV [Candidatus Levybacteria bacterium]
MNTAQRVILHIDFDSFFASVEQQLNPQFRAKPLGVTAANGRTCIIASSREAKKLGIKTGERTYVARKICPDIILTPSHFLKYWEISKKFLGICSNYSPYVELFSLDEVFMDITSTIHLFGSTQNVIESIKDRIKDEIGEYITVSVGVSHNKLLAKLASSINKPNGIGKIAEEDIDDIYKNAELTVLCGIGERIAARLNKLGIYSLLQIRDFSKEKLVREFGPAYTNVLIDMCWGKDEQDVVPYYMSEDVKSVGRNYCLPCNEYNKRVVMQNLYELCEEVGLKLRRLNKKARGVGVSLRGTCDISGRKTYHDYFDRGDEIFKRLKPIIDKHLCSVNTEYTRQISIWVHSLGDAKNLPASLFDNVLKKDKVQFIVDRLNDKFGDHTIRNGFLLYSRKLTTMPNGYMADRYERFQLAAKD